MKRILFFWLGYLITVSAIAQTVNKSTEDSLFVRQIFDQALVHGEGYKNLEYLCKVIGHRLSGSQEAEQAVVWGRKVMEKLPLDRVYLQPIEVPFWVRGDIEWAAISEDVDVDFKIRTLGGSVGTDGPMQGNLVEVTSLEEVVKLGKEGIEGKIVFYNRPMDPKPISTFESYGGCVDQRYAGASIASEYGAIAVLVRSMTHLENDRHAHTGSMGYKDGVRKIPAAAVSTQDANMLHQYLVSNGTAKITLNINAHTNEDVVSSNVIGEIRGSVYPEKVIVIGGHLDSWDVGQGAHDDGAGIVHSIEVLRILNAMNYKPRYTIRVVLFMNEENGNMGGKGYAAKAKANNENHVVAIESDRGGFSPRGFNVKADSSQVEFVRQFRSVLEEYGLHHFEPGYAGVDISPLDTKENKVNPDLIMMGLVPDSQRYFDYHHSDADVFESVNKRELELGCGAMAAMVYLIDKYLP
jgi:carboxypeptidase Q